MAETSFTLTTDQKTAKTVQYGTEASSVRVEITQGDVKVSVSSIVDDANNTSPDDTLYGDITATYSLSSYQVTKGSIAIQYAYSTGGTFYDCTRKGSEGEAASPLIVSQSGTIHTYVWDTATDLGDHYKGEVYLRIRAFDKVNQNGDFNTSNVRKITIDNSPFAPVISSPSDGEFNKDQRPEIIFTISDPKAGNSTQVHFTVKIASDSSFESDLKIWESRNSQHRNCFYYDSTGNGNYAIVPETGVDISADPSLIGNDVKFILPTEDRLSLGNYYITTIEGEVV